MVLIVFEHRPQMSHLIFDAKNNIFVYKYSASTFDIQIFEF